MTRNQGHTLLAASLLACALSTTLASAGPGGAPSPADEKVAAPLARVETVPVPHPRDAADDPAIWIHPTDPEKSLVLGTDKRGGLLVYNLDGSLRQLVSDRSRPDNVDVLYDVPLGGRLVDLALAGCRSPHSLGVKVWRIDPVADTLEDVTAGGVIPVLGGTEPYGSCVYRSARDGRSYFFANNKHGRVEQYRLEDDGNGRVRGVRVRRFHVSSTCEGCVADDELGWLYLAEEKVGIWKFDAEPDGGARRKLVTKVGEHGLTADVEGLTLYCAAGGKGYLIATSQSDNTFKVYEREDGNAFRLTIDPAAGPIGDVEHTDGIVVTNRPTSRLFPRGCFVVQDGENEPAHQNFKLFAWEDIAGSELIVDPVWSPRAADRAPVALASREGLDETVPWTSGSLPLETRSARFAPPGTWLVQAGIERQRGADETLVTVPAVLEYAVSSRLKLMIEPVMYSSFHDPGQPKETGGGGLELSLTALALAESGRRPAIAFAAETELPTAGNPALGSEAAAYTGTLILGRHLLGFDTHANLGVTVVGGTHGDPAHASCGYAFSSERAVGRLDLVAEVMGHSPERVQHADAATGDGGVVPEINDEELVGTLGGRYHVSERLLLYLGATWNSDRAFEIHPGFGFAF